MAKRAKMTHERAEQLALDWLAAQGTPAADGAQVEARAWKGDFRVRVWLEGDRESDPDHYLQVSADGGIEELEASRNARRAAAKRTGKGRGREKELPEGVSRRDRIPFVPADEDRDEITRLAEAHGLSAAHVVRELVAQALRGVAPSWAG